MILPFRVKNSSGKPKIANLQRQVYIFYTRKITRKNATGNLT